jgi:ABC-2 type transport system permease protein
MSQVGATASRLFKELIREKVVIFWTIMFPAIWLVMYYAIFLNGVPAEIKGSIMGVATVSMAVYGLMVAGTVDLPANIATDRTSGVLTKLRSMPVKPWRDFTGRLMAFTAFGIIAVAVVAVMGYIMGVRIAFTISGVAGALAFFGLAFMAASGIGLIIGALIAKEQSASMTGIIVSLVGGFVGGIFVSFRALPVFLQGFAQVYPLSGSTSSIVYLLFGERWAGYNPLTLELVALNVALSVGLFAVGQYLYAKRCWRAQ